MKMTRLSLVWPALFGALFVAQAKSQAPAASANAPAPPPPGMGVHQHPGGPHRVGGPDGMDMRLLPPGTWWRNQDVVSRIGLSNDQQKRIDKIFLDSRVQLIHMHASLEEEQLKLDSALQTTPFNENEASAHIDKVADTRADLEKANAKMLLTIRGVLTADQWTKLQAAGPGMAPPPGGMGDKRGDHRGAGRGGRPGGPDGPGDHGGPEGFSSPGI